MREMRANTTSGLEKSREAAQLCPQPCCPVAWRRNRHNCMPHMPHRPIDDRFGDVERDDNVELRVHWYKRTAFRPTARGNGTALGQGFLWGAQPNFAKSPSDCSSCTFRDLLPIPVDTTPASTPGCTRVTRSSMRDLFAYCQRYSRHFAGRRPALWVPAGVAKPTPPPPHPEPGVNPPSESPPAAPPPTAPPPAAPFPTVVSLSSLPCPVLSSCLRLGLLVRHPRQFSDHLRGQAAFHRSHGAEAHCTPLPPHRFCSRPRPPRPD